MSGQQFLQLRFHRLFNQLPSTNPQQFRQWVKTLGSIFQRNDGTLVHRSASFGCFVVSRSQINQIRRFFSNPQTPDSVITLIPPRYSVSFAVETIKKNTSRRLREKFRFLDKVYWDRGGIWSTGYFVSTVGITEEIIRRYVVRQGKEDAGQAQLEF